MSRFLVPLFFLVAAVGIFIVFTQPLIDGIKAQQADISIYQEALQNGQKLIDVRKRLLDRYNSFSSEDIGRLKKILPDAIDNVRLIIDLDTIASKYGMELKNVRIIAADSKNANATLGPDNLKYGSVGLGFTVTGSYEVFRRFVADLEKSLRVVDLVSVSFAANERNSYDYALEIRTYWLK